MKKILSFIIIFFPWRLRRLLLVKIWKYKIHTTAKIGLSYIYPRHLIMEAGSKINHFNIAIHLDKMEMGENATIVRFNWITGFPANTNSRHFAHQTDRKSELKMGKESAITKFHHIDCTNQIIMGNFVTISGYYSQLLTHSIDIYENRQDSKPIIIGNYCFVGTNSVILGGAELPAFSVLGANSLLNKAYAEQYKLYGGVPAKPTKSIAEDAKYFNRKTGFVF
jgi:acetyltransferase-like isoleucine patch superfamily enzyme